MYICTRIIEKQVSFSDEQRETIHTQLYDAARLDEEGLDLEDIFNAEGECVGNVISCLCGIVFEWEPNRGIVTSTCTWIHQVLKKDCSVMMAQR